MTDANTRIAALEAALVLAETDRAIGAHNLSKHASLLRQAMNPVALVRDYAGQPQVCYKQDGVAVTADEFIQRIKAESPKLNESDAPTKRPAPPNTKGIANPYRKHPKLWNLTTQFALEKSQPALAAQLKLEAEAVDGPL
ncbi:MAG: hypothetical protein JSR89_17075 [Proteobacteria bacterium]|nr:hypothetical protein [Pseudomonadota bacterium]